MFVNVHTKTVKRKNHLSEIACSLWKGEY